MNSRRYSISIPATPSPSVSIECAFALGRFLQRLAGDSARSNLNHCCGMALGNCFPLRLPHNPPLSLNVSSFVLGNMRSKTKHMSFQIYVDTVVKVIQTARVLTLLLPTPIRLLGGNHAVAYNTRSVRPMPICSRISRRGSQISLE